MWYVFLFFFIPWAVSLWACLTSARKMHFSVTLAAWLGVLFSPAAGITYGYMLVSHDRKPWRVALASVVLYLVLIFSLLGILSSASHSHPDSSVGNSWGVPAGVQNVPPSVDAANKSTNHVEPSTGAGSTATKQPVSAETPTQTISTATIVGCKGLIQAGSSCTRLPATIKVETTATGKRVLLLYRVNFPNEEPVNYPTGAILSTDYTNATLLEDWNGVLWSVFADNTTTY